MSLIANTVGAVAAICSMASFVPQILKIHRERDASSVSLRTYAVTVTGFTLWTIYGLMTGIWPVIGSNIICLSLAAVILVQKARYSARERV